MYPARVRAPNPKEIRMPRKAKKAAATKTSNVNKSEWVRSQPATMAAKDVVAKAKEAGIAITDKYVHTIRYNAKAGKKKAGKAVGAAKRGPGRPKGSKNGTRKLAHAVGAHGAEDLLKAVAAEIGLVHAISVLTAEHERVHRILGG
jgi:hypothetical protein